MRKPQSQPSLASLTEADLEQLADSPAKNMTSSSRALINRALKGSASASRQNYPQIINHQFLPIPPPFRIFRQIPPPTKTFSAQDLNAPDPAWYD